MIAFSHLPAPIRARNKKLKLKVFLLHWGTEWGEGDKESVWAWLAKLDDIKLLLVLRKVHFLRNFCVIYNTSWEGLEGERSGLWVSFQKPSRDVRKKSGPAVGTLRTKDTFSINFSLRRIHILCINSRKRHSKWPKKAAIEKPTSGFSVKSVECFWDWEAISDQNEMKKGNCDLFMAV